MFEPFRLVILVQVYANITNIFPLSALLLMLVIVIHGYKTHYVVNVMVV